MPKRSSAKEQEVIGQIFDFIFKEAKKKPEKRKPIKVSGLNGKNMLIDGLTAALERPGAFITEQAAKDLNDALDLTLTKLKPDQNNPVPSVKISASNLINIIRDPMGTMQKAKDTADAMRKSSRAKFIREGIRDLTVNGWARKYADLDTQQAVRLGLVAQNATPKEARDAKIMDTWSMQAALGMAASGRKDGDANSLAQMQERAGTLIGRSIFTEQRWNSLSPEDQEDFGKIFALTQSTKADDVLNTRYASARLREMLRQKGFSGADRTIISTRYETKIKEVAVEGNISLANPAVYRNLEIGNLDERIQALENGVPGLSPAQASEQINSFKKAKLLINAQDLDGAKVRYTNNKLIGWINQTKNDIRNETDTNRKKELKLKLKELNGDRRQLNTLTFWDTVGTAEGYWGSLKALTEGELVTQILTGSFFDPDQNDALRPSKTTKSAMGIKIFVPRDDGAANWINRYNESVTDMYYYTPKAWIRTLFLNGEGFAYSMFKKEKSIQALLGKDLKFNDLRGDILDDKKSMASIQQLLTDYQRKFPGANKEQLEKMLAGYVRVGKLHRFFSFNQRVKDAVGGAIEKMMVKARIKLVKSFMKNKFFKDIFRGAAGKVLGQWIAKGGLQNLARVLVIGVANALGFATTGGLANVVITVIAGVVSDALFAIGKVLFGIVIFALIGVVGIFIMGFGALKDFQKQTYTYANTVPGEVVYNPNFIDDNYIIDGGDPGAPGTVYTGNAQQIFDSVRREMGLSTQLRLVDCSPTGPASDKAACSQIDWAWCYSGTQVFCRVDKIAKASNAGLTNLFRHELVHQIQHGGTSLIREWGADFLSNNGGGYSFNTRYGVQRATATTSYLLGTGFCSVSQLQKIAVGDGLSTPCGAAVSSFILGFAVRK